MDTRQKRRRKPSRPQPEAARKKKPAQRRTAVPRSKAPEVVYTPAKPFNRGRLLLQLATIAAVVVAVVLGISVFFKVKTVTVAGNSKYSAWAIREASGIQEGENLLTFNEPRAVGRIKKQLPYVDKARIGIKLPDTLQIYVEEFEVVYAVQDSSNSWWLIRSDGVVAEKTDAGSASDYTQLMGFRLQDPVAGEPAVAAEEQIQLPETTEGEEPAEETDAPEETLPLETGVTVTGRQRLEAAVQILQGLEKLDIIGDAASVDVTNLTDLKLWYGEQYQVKLGDLSRLDYKLNYMKKTIEQLEAYQAGILDVSFTIMKDQAMYTPF